MGKNTSVQQLELRKRLQQAIEGGRYFITITTPNGDSPRLNHYWAWDNFPAIDVVPTLEHIAKEVVKGDKGRPQ